MATVVFKQGNDDTFIYKDNKIISDLQNVIDISGKYNDYDAYILNQYEVLCIKPIEDRNLFRLIKIAKIDLDNFVEVWCEYRLSAEINDLKCFRMIGSPYTYYRTGFAKLINEICGNRN